MKWLKRIAVAIVVLAVVGYGGLLVYFSVNQRNLQYERTGAITPLGETALSGAEVVSIPTEDGAVLAGWYQAPQPGKPLVVYFRGNTGSFTRERERYEAFVGDGYGFLAFDYRGFPGSPGELTEDHMLADALAGFDFAASKGFPLVLWGRSLGSGAATWVAGHRDVDAVFLETPYLSFVRIGTDKYPFIPVALLLQDQYPQETWIRDVAEPVYVAHGTADQTIAVYQAEALHRLVPNPDELWIVPGGTHSDLWTHGEWDRAKAFYSRIEAGLGR